MINKPRFSVNERAGIVICLLLTLLVWGATLAFGFVWDDIPTIVENPSLGQWGTLFRAWFYDFWGLHETPLPSGYWRPLPTVVYVFLTQIFGKLPAAFHAANLVVHSFCVWGVYRLLESFGLKRVSLLLAVLFFALHPIHSETISFVSTLPDLLAACLGIWSWVWLSRGMDRVPNVLLAALLLGLSLLSKESAIVFSIGWLLFLPSSSPQRFSVIALFFAVTGVYVVAHYFVTSGIQGRDLWGGDFSRHFATVFRLLPYAVFLLFLPYPTTPTREFPIGSGWADPWFIASLFSISVVTVFVWKRGNDWPLMKKAVLWFVFFWLPVSNIFPIEGLFADRYLYLPSIAGALGIGMLAQKIEEKGGWLRAPLAKVALFLLVFVWGGLALANSLSWRSEKTLWRQATEVSPGASVAWNEWGKISMKDGRFDEAKNAFAKAILLQPNHQEARLNLATLSWSQRNFEEAEDQMKKYLFDFPTDARGWDLYASALESKGDRSGAENASRKAVSLAPNQWKFRFNLSATLLRQNNYSEAIPLLEVARRLAPERERVWMNLAAAYYMDGSWEKAASLYRDILSRWPNQVNARNNLQKVESQIERLASQAR